MKMVIAPYLFVLEIFLMMPKAIWNMQLIQKFDLVNFIQMLHTFLKRNSTTGLT